MRNHKLFLPVERNCAFTGARKSECFALRWSDVDLTRGKETARIVRQFYKGELVDETKTPAGAREIILAPRAAKALRELSVAQQLDEHADAAPPLRRRRLSRDSPQSPDRPSQREIKGCRLCA